MLRPSVRSGLHNETIARLIVAVGAAVSALMQLVQISSTSYLRGDGPFYLRDAYVFSRFGIPGSRYSIGYALFLSPIARVFPNDPSAAGITSLIVNALLSAVAVVLVHRFLRTYLPTMLAAALAAVLLLGQVVVAYFAEIRPEPLALVLVTGLLLCLDRERDGWAVALTAFAALVRVSLVPFLAVVWLVRFRRSRRPSSAALALIAASIAIYFLATGSGRNQSYTQIGGALYKAEGGGNGTITGFVRTVLRGAGIYSRYGVPRLVWPQAALSSAVGILVAAAMLGAMVVGLFVLLRRRPPATPERSYGVLLAASAGTVVYGAALLAWPIRDLAAVRMIVPVGPVLLLWLGAFVVAVADRSAPRHRSRLLIALAAGIVVVTLTGSTVLLADELGNNSRADFAAAHEAARDALPPGPIISPSPAGTELILHRTTYEVPLGKDIGQFAREVRSCVFVLDNTTQGEASWVEKHKHRTLGRSGSVRVVKIEARWCR